jgi:hypothetical protein
MFFEFRRLKYIPLHILIVTAMSSCVLKDQNELVVRTGLDLRLRRLDTTKIKRGSFVFVVDSSARFNETMCHIMNTTMKALYDSGISSDCIHERMPNIKLFNSILDLPKQDRSTGIIICFDEPSYNGRQCLYHLFGEKLGLKPYQAFIDAMEQTQKNGDAIVFTQEEVMWFPSGKNNKENSSKETSSAPIDQVTTPVFPSADMDFFGGKQNVPLQEVSHLVRTWIQVNKNRKEATHITAGPSVGVEPSKGVSGHLYWSITGYKDGKELWRDSVIGVLPEETTAKVTKAKLLVETINIVDAVKTLTDAVEKLSQKLA